MASIGHVVLGLAAARLGRPTRWVPWAVALSVLSLLPDLDVIGLRLGVSYSAPLGHRGATHSLLVALVVGLLAAFALRRICKPPFALTALLCVAVVASHGLLDALTDGGLGVALLWPFSAHRYFAPLRPLPVAPIGARLLSARGLHVVTVELIYFLPVAVFALWPRSGRRAAP